MSSSQILMSSADLDLASYGIVNGNLKITDSNLWIVQIILFYFIIFTSFMLMDKIRSEWNFNMF